MIKKFFYLSICVGALIALNSCEQDSDSEQKPSEKDVIPVEVIVAKEIEIGSSFDITAVFQNQGDTIISKPSVTKVYLSKDKLINGDDDVFIGEVVLQTKLVPNIAVQEKITIDSEEILKNIELGAYYVILEADSSNVIDEVNEENNVYVTSFTIEFKEKADEEVPDEMEVEALGKDLTILEITTDKTEYTRLEKFEANVLFKVGSEDIEEFSVTNFYLSADKILNKENDTYVGFSSFRNSKASADIEENISGGANQFGINALSGSYYLIAEIDSRDEIDEINEDNNEYVSDFKITISDNDTDLAVSNSNFKIVDDPEKDHNLELSVTIINNGTDQVKSVFYEYFLSSNPIFDDLDKKIGFLNFMGLDWRDSRSGTDEIKFEISGEYYLFVKILDRGQEIDINDSNLINNIQNLGKIIIP